MCVCVCVYVCVYVCVRPCVCMYGGTSITSGLGVGGPLSLLPQSSSAHEGSLKLFHDNYIVECSSPNVSFIQYMQNYLK